jgi:hypothetical protein
MRPSQAWAHSALETFPYPINGALVSVQRCYERSINH